MQIYSDPDPQHCLILGMVRYIDVPTWGIGRQLALCFYKNMLNIMATWQNIIIFGNMCDDIKNPLQNQRIGWQLWQVSVPQVGTYHAYRYLPYLTYGRMDNDKVGSTLFSHSHSCYTYGTGSWVGTYRAYLFHTYIQINSLRSYPYHT